MKCKDIRLHDFLFPEHKASFRVLPPAVKSHSTIYYIDFATQHDRSFIIALILSPGTAMKCNLSSLEGDS